MGLEVPSGTKREMGSGLDGTPRECRELSGTEDLCLLIRVSQVRDLYGLQRPSFEAKLPRIFESTRKTAPFGAPDSQKKGAENEAENPIL